MLARREASVRVAASPATESTCGFPSRGAAVSILPEPPQPLVPFIRLPTKGVKEVRVRRHVIDGEFACVIADLETTEGAVVPFCEFFHVVDGRIAEIRPFFDPRHLIR